MVQFGGLAGGQVQLEVGVGDYFEYIDTCLCYGYDAANYLVEPARGMPLREEFPLSTLSNRHAQLGIVTLVVLRNVLDPMGRSSWMLLHERGENVVESANLSNAVPGATFQPANADIADPLSEAALNGAILETVTREFCEEVFNVEEFSELTTSFAVRDRAEWQLVSENTYFIGIGFNPLNAYFEMLCLSVLDVASPLGMRVFGSDRLEDIERKINPNDEGGITLKSFNEDTINHYAHQYRSAPALKQICRILSGRIDSVVISAATENTTETPSLGSSGRERLRRWPCRPIRGVKP